MTSTRIEHSYGNPEAPVCITEFGDFECPYCAGAAPVLRQLIDSSDGQVRLIFKNFPLFEVHPHALTAALAAESTSFSGGEQAFWKMHDKLFVHQSRLTDPDLRLYAKGAGGDPDLATGAAAQQFAAIVQDDYAAGIAAGVSGTPALFIDGVAYEGRIELGALRRAVGSPAGASAAMANAGGSGDAAESRRRPWQRR
ncbi:MAG: oxidoreductase [Frankiales bacterium]|nr:oxidoreductase [Frankiales bacterium]